MKLLYSILLTLFLVSCGSYKRSSTETKLNKDVEMWQKLQNDKIVFETLKTTLDYYGVSDSSKVISPLKAKPKYTLTQTKTTKTTDKGTLEKNTTDKSALKVEDENKENPWRPPWYLSGLIVLVLLVVYKVFKTKFKIVKI